MNEYYWQDGDWHEPEKEEPPMAKDLMIDTEVFFGDLIANEPDIQKQKKYAEFAWNKYKIKATIHEQDEQNQAA